VNTRFFAIILTALGIAAGPAAAQTPAPMHTPKTVHQNYSCHNLKVPVTYDNVKNRALVTYGARRYALPHVMSADGARYMNDKLEWWEKGPTATLSSVTDGKADTVLATCTAIVKK
jgi:membrane-bound inhibitor of C-type lysozyme